MRKLNSGCTKSLSKLLNECQVPAEIRDNIPVIADDIGVVWVWGVGVCQRCAVNKKTKKAFKIEAQKY